MMSFTLNWFGMAVHNVPAATDFYSQKLGFLFWQNEEKFDAWRMFETRRMSFELFKAHADRFKVKAWGDGQGFRPAILVDDLPAAAATLQGHDVPFAHETSKFGHQLEISGPEGIRWSLVDGLDAEMDWAHPVIGGIELKASNLAAQKDFYTQIFGMTMQHQTEQAVHLTQTNGDAWLRIQAGGTSTPLPAEISNPKPAFFFPIWISYETKDVEQANDWLQQQKVTVLHPLTHHEDWGGTDIIITDVDGNPIQIVQYGKPGSD